MSGCPIRERLADFDPFGATYMADPAGALAAAREEAPVFFAPAIGYWVVTRYEDVKAVFRDPITFSPSIALEKITPPTDEAVAVLKRYGYQLNRTLVNEDEPQHMERRRLLMESFEPAALERHKPMVRRLVNEAIDRFEHRGEADLVEELFFPVPLTVALHFLGVPEDDQDALKRFSVAHTVNTWGRPSETEQVAVAEAVGKFWQYSGTVLERMRADPSGDGWMKLAIRKQRDHPDVVTDSYLHSMMMAILVAAHETTAHASANMLRLLLERRAVWEEVCARPSLIANTVEEALRHSGSIVAWRRIATADTMVGGVAISEGERLLVSMASANHDPRRFPEPDALDIWREDTASHLSFGYGAHQCMGKNIARMEMRIFLDELTRRLPHLALAEQPFEYLPNVSFRGPRRLLARWDVASNPARPRPVHDVPIGAPDRRALAREVVVEGIDPAAEGVVTLSVADPQGNALPPWTAGAHIELTVGDFERDYSLCGAPDAPTYTVAVLKEGEKGGSAYVHERLRRGDRVLMRGPRNRFALSDDGARAVLVAGGIGITPILAMADRLRARGTPYSLHYAGRKRGRMAFLDRLGHDHAGALTVYVSDEGTRLDLAALHREADGAQVYACGPERLLKALSDTFADRPDALHVERFSGTAPVLDPSVETPFDATLADSAVTVTVGAGETLLQALRARGFDVPSDCEEGICGSCEVRVLAGTVDHRDAVLTAAERAEGTRMMACCSRAKDGGDLKLAL